MKIVTCPHCLNKYNLDYAVNFESLATNDCAVLCPHCKIQLLNSEIEQFQTEYDKYLMKQQIDNLLLVRKTNKLLDDTKK